MSKFWPPPNLKLSLALSILGIVFSQLFLFPLIEVPRLKAKDFFLNRAYQLKKNSQAKPEELIIVEIDDASYQELNQRWPWKRDIFVSFLENIREASPKVILFDLGFIGKEEPIYDFMLAESIKNSKNIILSFYFGSFAQAIKPLSSLYEGFAEIGFINKPLDKDSLIRKTPLFLNFFNQNHYAVELLTAAIYRNIPVNEFSLQGDIFYLGRDKIPLDKDKNLIINYARKPADFERLSFYKVINKDFSPQLFKDKIVLIGASSEIFHDVHLSPLGRVPGVYILANIIQMLLEKKLISEISYFWYFLLLSILGAAIGLVSYRYPGFKSLGLGLLVILLFWLVSLELFLQNWQWDCLAIPLALGLIFLGVNFYRYVYNLMEIEHLRQISITDELTQLFSFRYFQVALENEVEKTRRYKQNLSLLLIDIDHFKKINDTYGHPFGNEILKNIAMLIRENTRKTDIVARYGGEEFVIILPQATFSWCKAFGERLRQTAENYLFLDPYGKSLGLTISLGGAAFQSYASAEEFIEAVDRALYQAKNSGRNKISMAERTKGLEDTS